MGRPLHAASLLKADNTLSALSRVELLPCSCSINREAWWPPFSPQGETTYLAAMHAYSMLFRQNIRFKNVWVDVHRCCFKELSAQRLLL